MILCCVEFIPKHAACSHRAHVLQCTIRDLWESLLAVGALHARDGVRAQLDFLAPAALARKLAFSVSDQNDELVVWQLSGVRKTQHGPLDFHVMDGNKFVIWPPRKVEKPARPAPVVVDELAGMEGVEGIEKKVSNAKRAGAGKPGGIRFALAGQANRTRRVVMHVPEELACAGSEADCEDGPGAGSGLNTDEDHLAEAVSQEEDAPVPGFDAELAAAHGRVERRCAECFEKTGLLWEPAEFDEAVALEMGIFRAARAQACRTLHHAVLVLAMGQTDAVNFIACES